MADKANSTGRAKQIKDLLAVHFECLDNPMFRKLKDEGKESAEEKFERLAKELHAALILLDKLVLTFELITDKPISEVDHA